MLMEDTVKDRVKNTVKSTVLAKISATRRALIAGACLMPLVLWSGGAQADEAAEQFIAGVLDEANEFIGADEETRIAGIESLVGRYVNMRRVGRFALGQYARVMTDAQAEIYYPLFERYATLVYRKALTDYSGQKLAVKDSIDRSERDIIVNSRVLNPKPGDRFANITIHWRVYRSRSGEMSVFDAGADGIWLALEQQSQFKSVIANNGGGEKGIDALIAQLRKQVDG